MSNPNLKYRIKLSQEQRQELIEISKNGIKSAKQVNHAQVLLMSDDNAIEGRWRDEDISQALNMHVNTVAGIRKKFGLEGVKPALQRKPRETPPVDNIAPTIVSIDKPATIKEGESGSFSANAIDPGSNNNLTYSRFQYFNLVGWLLSANT